jgi:glycosyltransferase involved in cell wall biosynthesis
MSANPTGKPCVTVITPVYNEHENLAHYASRVGEALLGSAEYEFRFLFVDDGSSDSSWEAIRGICRGDARFSGIRLSRNYGSHIALSAGFAAASGDAITTLACDLQDPPEVILEFLGEWRRGAKIVWGRRRSRQDATWRAIASRAFHGLLTRFAMPRESKFTTGSFLLVDRLVAECFNRFQEHHRITFAIVAWTGFEQAVVDYDRQARTLGRSKWNFTHMLKTMYDAFIGFSMLPIRVMTITGAAIFLLAVVLMVYLLVTWLIEEPAPGWTSQMGALAFFFGLQFLLMGITGEYLYRIYAEVVRRPLYFVAETVGADLGKQ